MTARHCAYFMITRTIPINDGMRFTFGGKEFGNDLKRNTVTHLGTAKKFDVSAFRVIDPDDYIQTLQFGKSSPIFQCQQEYFSGYSEE